MNTMKKQLILSLLTNCPMISTNHAALFFSNTGNPMKRASEHLKWLESEKLVEGKSRAIGYTKVWRLTKKGRETVGTDMRPISFTSGKLEHWLSITNDYISLSSLGELRKWEVEPRYEFMYGNKRMFYAPDAYLTLKFNGKFYAYFLEHQDSPLTTKRWAEKWAVLSHFMDSPAFKTASFQTARDRGIIITPKILVVSSQQPETIQGGSALRLLVGRDIKSALLN